MMENIVCHIRKLVLASTLLLGLLLTHSANATPKGPYLVGEAGFGYVNDNYLEGLDGVYSGQVVYASVQQTTRAQSSERVAFGYYLAHSDPIMSFGIEVGYNYFNQLDSSTSTSISSQSVTGHQQSSAWYASLEEITSFDLCHAVNFFVKFGGGYADISRSVNLSTNAIKLQTGNSDNSSGFGLSAGGGFQFAFDRYVGLRIEIDGFAGENSLSYMQGLAGFIVGFYL